MPILAQNIDYTELDQESLERRIFRLIDTAFPEWSERARINHGNLLVGAFSMVGDILAFIMDNQAADSRWTTARLRRSILALVKLIAYRPASARAATVDVVITMPAMAGTVAIPAGSRILTDQVTSPIAYQTLVDVELAPGQTQATVAAENSATWTELFTSTELADQAFVLGRTGVLDGSVQLTAADGTYSEVDDFLDSTSSSRDFTLAVDAQDRGVVRTGSGVLGAIPKGTVSVTYKTGGGVLGRLEPNKLRRFESTFFDSLGNPARPMPSNPAKSSGGDDRESNTSIQANAPRSLRVQNRCVSREDYEIVAELTSGVARALHLTGNEMAGIGENQGQVFIVPEGGGAPSSAVLAAVAARYDPETGDYPKTNTYQVLVAAAPYLTINVQSSLFLAQGYTGTEGRAKARKIIVEGLVAFFALTMKNGKGESVRNPKVDFGWRFKRADGSPFNRLSWSDVFNVIRDSAAVSQIDPGTSGLLLNEVRDDVGLLPQHFPVLGNVVLIDALTGTQF